MREIRLRSPISLPPLHCSLIISKELCSQAVLLRLPKKKTSFFLLALSLPLSALEQNPACQIKQTQACTTLCLSALRLKTCCFFEKHEECDSACKRKSEKNSIIFHSNKQQIKEFFKMQHCGRSFVCPTKKNL